MLYLNGIQRVSDGSRVYETASRAYFSRVVDKQCEGTV
jgi:hypothetical protein